jgi:uncharacterized protein (TIGR02611 family)
MIRSLKEQWRALRQAPPGKRFHQRYERRKQERKSPAARVAWTALAVLLVVVGIIALPLPGPGFIPIGIGLALLAQESAAVARFCDRAELAIRKLVPGGA